MRFLVWVSTLHKHEIQHSCQRSYSSTCIPRAHRFSGCGLSIDSASSRAGVKSDSSGEILREPLSALPPHIDTQSIAPATRRSGEPLVGCETSMHLSRDCEPTLHVIPIDIEDDWVSLFRGIVFGHFAEIVFPERIVPKLSMSSEWSNCLIFPMAD